MTESGFTVDVDQNQYLPEGGREVSAIVTVTSAADATGLPGSGPVGAEPDGSAEIIIIDCSGSMEYPHSKIAEARAATAAAVDVVRDGVLFSVIAGTNLAWPAFPADGSMVRADASSRAAAKQAVAALRAGGGTAIGQWLELARQTFGRYPAKLRHAILLTDGKNQHETPEQLAAAIRQCEGVFSCDCRGVGTDWEVKELRTIDRPARQRGHRARPVRAGRRFRGHDAERDGQAGRHRGAAGVDPAARHGQVRQAGRGRR